MVTIDSTRYSKRQGRKFGLTLGPAFAALAAFLWWQNHMRAAWVMAALAGLLSFLALAAPTSLRRVESTWMGFAHALSRVTTPVFMGIVYYFCITPIGALRRAFGKDAIRASGGASEWVEHHSSGDLNRQF